MLPTWLRQPGFSLKYVVDISPDATAELARQYGRKPPLAKAFWGTPLSRLWSSLQVPDTHADLIIRSAAAGKAIFCEKPVDLDLDRARKCADAVSKAGVICMIGFNRRFDPTFAALKKRLDSGEIGEAEMLIITSRDPGAPSVSTSKAREVSSRTCLSTTLTCFDSFSARIRRRSMPPGVV